MDANLDKIAVDLYGKIQTRFPDIKIGDENARVLSKKEDIPLARFFEFEYEENGKKLGTIAITLDSTDGIVIQVGGDLTDDNAPSHNAYDFIKSFRKFAKTRLLNFDVQDIGKSNMDKRDYQFQAKRKEMPDMTQAPIMENKMYGTNKISYQDLGEARLIIKHNKAVNLELAAGRTMHIESIYIENANGERFMYPFKHLNGARALAEHIKHGGIPYDAIGKHITGLSEELAGLRKFKGYVNRTPVVSEAMGTINNRVIERIEAIKKEVHGLQRKAYYETFAESFKEFKEQMIPEDVMTDWVDRLTIRTFNEELKSVFPYIYKIVGESGMPIRELSADDFLSNDAEDDDNQYDKDGKLSKTGKYDAAGHYDKEKEDDGIDTLESFMDNIISENGLIGHNIDQQAIDEFLKVMSTELIGGVYNNNSVGTIKELIPDAGLLHELEIAAPNVDVRGVIYSWIDRNRGKFSPVVYQQIVAAKHNAGLEEPKETPPPELPETLPETPPETPPAELPAAAGEVPEPGQLPPVAENKRTKLIRALESARRAGANLDTVLEFGFRSMTLGEAFSEFGMTPEEHGYNNQEAPVEYTGKPTDEILKSIAGFWNREARNFTIGGQRAKIKIIKDFKEGMFPNARQDDVKQVLALIDKMDPSGSEQGHIVKLAGIKNTDNREDKMDQLVHELSDDTNILVSPAMSEGILYQIKRNAGLLKG